MALPIRITHARARATRRNKAGSQSADQSRLRTLKDGDLTARLGGHG